MNVLTVPNGIVVALFGIVLSASSAEIGSGPPSPFLQRTCAVSSGAGQRFWWSR